MLNCHLPGAIRGVGASQGYHGISVKHADLENGNHAVVTCWEPTPEELEKLAKGGRIMLFILGTMQPPVLLTVGEPPE